jgi:hypothetical protein
MSDKLRAILGLLLGFALLMLSAWAVERTPQVAARVTEILLGMGCYAFGWWRFATWEQDDYWSKTEGGEW